MADELSGAACDRVATGVRVVMIDRGYGGGRIIFAVEPGVGLLSGDYFVDRKWIPGYRFGRQKKKREKDYKLAWWKRYTVCTRSAVQILDMHVL